MRFSYENISSFPGLMTLGVSIFPIRFNLRSSKSGLVIKSFGKILYFTELEKNPHFYDRMIYVFISPKIFEKKKNEYVAKTCNNRFILQLVPV